MSTLCSRFFPSQSSIVGYTVRYVMFLYKRSLWCYLIVQQIVMFTIQVTYTEVKVNTEMSKAITCGSNLL